MFRIGLSMLEQLHCGIDVSKKIAADQAVLDGEQQKLDEILRRTWLRHSARHLALRSQSSCRSNKPLRSRHSLRRRAIKRVCRRISASISGRKEKGGRAQATTREVALTYNVVHTTTARLRTAEARLLGA
ncbi:hypothetical protein AC630_37425 [Bradyrhizobium sp. AS23.2]|nr:hypothetical protein AC630_37425 [Bradyrhizobium sp. AS23.2]